MSEEPTPQQKKLIETIGIISVELSKIENVPGVAFVLLTLMLNFFLFSTKKGSEGNALDAFYNCLKSKIEEAKAANVREKFDELNDQIKNHVGSLDKLGEFIEKMKKDFPGPHDNFNFRNN